MSFIKVLILSLLFVFGFQPTLYAAQNARTGQLGLGLILGAPTGISAKYWLDNTHAVDAALGLGGPSIHADYLWHRWDGVPQPEPQSGRLAIYWGLGARVEDEDKKKDIELAIRAVGGITYDFSRYPADLFLEVVPALVLSPDSDLEVDVGLGVRYYFK
jgi:hypothetical protein